MNTKIPHLLLGLASGFLSASQLHGIQQVSSPSVSPEGAFASEATPLRVTADVSVDADLLPTSINLVRKSNTGQWVVVGRMYDDGTHGDALVGDGTFTINMQLNEPAPGSVDLAVSVAYRRQIRRLLSPTTNLPVVRRPAPAELDIATNVPLQGQQLFELRRAQIGDAGARDELLADLLTEPGVADAGLSFDGNYIWINFTSGLRGGIITAPPGTRADPSFVGAQTSIALASYFDQFSPFDETDNIAQRLGSFGGINPSVFKNAQATVDAFKFMSGAGVVSITAHGAVNSGNEVVILTREPVTLATRLAHFTDWALFGRLENWGGVWAICPNFVRAYCSFPDSIVYVGSCNSAANGTMANAFLGNGAKTYFGYSKVVNSDFAFSTGTALFSVLTDPMLEPESRTTKVAFDSIATKTDPTSPHAVFTMWGSGNMALRNELVVNGRFELGDLSGWIASGPGYTKVVSEDKSEGIYSGRLGRWDQVYMQGGRFNGPSVPGAEPYGTDMISQDVDLPGLATSLPFTFDYNVVTYDGAAYDWLDVTVLDANTGVRLVQPVSRAGGIIAGSINNWGLYYTTGWRHVSVDLAPYKGRKVRIVFGVRQDGYGDQCAAYIDNVSIRSQ